MSICAIYLKILLVVFVIMWVENQEKDTRQKRIDEANRLKNTWEMDLFTFEKLMKNVASYPFIKKDLLDILDDNSYGKVGRSD